jgi:hypothetical protein
MSLPPYVTRSDVHRRLQIIFPEGVPQRNYCVREIAASAVFLMLYIGAIDGENEWLAPKHVMRMTEQQALLATETDRLDYRKAATRSAFRVHGRRWYQDNSREALRDETLRQGLIGNNAVVERPGLATTSAKPRYALQREFAALFSPTMTEDQFIAAAKAWSDRYLSASARARIELIRRGTAPGAEGELVRFPSGETRRMKPGPSSLISKAVIEQFAPRFLVTPAVLWLSESGAKVVARDDELATRLGLRIPVDRNLPDIILVDLGEGDPDQVLLLFVEVVASDGPVTSQRQASLLSIATEADFPAERVVFLTAYVDRAHPSFRKTVAELAWRSFAWFVGEPGHLLVLHNGESSPRRLADLI